ncbi:MAG TPA: hypothetical protein VFO84_00780 [Dehalococcoidia bacterium]|nr:hypothetical protein [Dehalococcoidia bacterium]
MKLSLTLALLGVLLLTGCDPNDDDSEPTPDPRLDIEFEPADLICTEDDIPPSFEYEAVVSGEVDDEEAAAGSADPDERREQFERWGREGGQFAAFSSEQQADEPDEVAYVECGIDRYETIAGAEAAFFTLSRGLEERAQQSLESQGFEEVAFEDIPSPQIGDETAAVSGTASKDGQPFEFFAVTFRRLNMVGYSLSVAPERFSFVEDAANITAQMVKLMDDELEDAEEELEDEIEEREE